MANESGGVVAPPAEPQGLAQIARRDGETYVHGRDGFRLAAQHQRVFDACRDGRWRTLAEISAATGDPEASVSARLRDFRKERFGEHGVARRHVGEGLFEYRLILNRLDLFE